MIHRSWTKKLKIILLITIFLLPSLSKSYYYHPNIGENDTENPEVYNNPDMQNSIPLETSVDTSKEELPSFEDEIEDTPIVGESLPLQNEEINNHIKNNYGKISISSFSSEVELNSDYIVWLIEEDNNQVDVFKSNTEDIPVVSLEDGIYIIEVIEINSIKSDPIILRQFDRKEFRADFNKLTLIPYDFSDLELEANVEIFSEDGRIWGPKTIKSDVNKDLYVTPGKYKINSSDSSIGTRSIDATIDAIVPLMISTPAKNSNLGLDEDASFGVIVVNASTYRDRPLSAVVVRWVDLSVTSDCTSGGYFSTNTTGMVSFNLAPGDYKLCSYKSYIGARIVNDSLSIVGGTTTIINVGFSHIVAYTDGNRYVTVSNSTYTFGSSYSGADGMFDLFAPAGTYNFVVSNDIDHLGVVVDFKGFVESGTKVNNAPTFTYVQASSRVTANQSTTIEVYAKDINYDYLIFYFNVNTGTINAATPRWVTDNVWGITLNFTAPIINDFYELSLGVQDDSLLFNNYTIYLSSRTSELNLRTREKDYLPISTYVIVRDKMTSSTTNYGYSGTDGNITWSVLDGRYYYSFSQANTFVTDFFKLDANVGVYNYQFNFTRITINTTSEWDRGLSTSIFGYNGTSGLSTSVFSFGTPASGVYTHYVVPYSNYSIESRRTNSMWQQNFFFNEALHYNISFSFGTLAVYTYNGEIPQSRYIILYNYTDGTQLSYGYSGGDGINVFYLNPYSNYSVWDYTNDVWYTAVQVTAGEALAIGDFVNSNPVISSIKTIPIAETRIYADESVQIEVIASDIDTIDQLNYTWSVNVGSISGTSSIINYTAPATNETYKITVLVQDKFGGNASQYIYVSNRLSTMNLNFTQSNGEYYSGYFTLKRDRDWATIKYGYVGSGGLYSYNTLLDEEYTIYATESGTTISYSFIANQSTYNFEFKFAEFIFNSTSYLNTGISSTVRIRDPVTRVNLYSTTTSSITGLSSRLRIKSGIYDIEVYGNGAASIWKDNITINENELQTLDYLFAEIQINVTAGFGNPLNTYITLYNGTDSSLLSYVYIGTDGLFSYHVAPGNYTIQTYTSPLKNYYNIITTQHILYELNVALGTLVVHANDGINFLNKSVWIYYPGTTTQVTSTSTGADGVQFMHLQPGIYDIKIDVITYPNIVIQGSERTEVGTRINHEPVIISATGSNIGINSQTSVTIKLSDLDYDYENIFLLTSVNVGWVSNPSYRGEFTTQDNFFIYFDYNSPGILGIFVVNITISDGEDTAFYMLIVSNQSNTMEFKSVRGDNLPQSTPVYVTDYQSGVSIFSGTTDANTGRLTTSIVDGWYNIRFTEHNSIYFRNVLVSNGDIYNITALFGDVFIYSTGAGGVPLNSYTIVTNQTTSATVAYGYTGADGVIEYILAPGIYTVEVVQTTSIFFNLLIEGGVTSLVGSEIPNMITIPEDIFYQYNDIGNSLTWNVTDGNPDTYLITRNGTQIHFSIWDGGNITINVDGLDVGWYEFKIVVNDTYGFYNFDVVKVYVTQPPGPLATGVGAVDVIFGGSVLHNWTASAIAPDRYEIYFEEVSMINDTWSNGTIQFLVSTQVPGLYNLTLVLYDIFNASYIHIVAITFLTDPLPFDMLLPSNTSYIYGETGNEISWIFADNNPAGFTIWLDGFAISNGVWLSNQEIILDIDDYILGRFNITIAVYDVSGGSFSHTLFLDVTLDTVPPSITSSYGDVTMYLGDTELIGWSVYDLNPTNYTLYADGVPIFSDNWGNIFPVEYLFDPTASGIFELTIVFFDISGNSASNTVIVTVLIPDTISPLINGIKELIVMEGSSIELYWNVSDANPKNYIILQNATELETGSWSNGNISILISGLEPGIYNISIIIYDINANMANFTTMLVVEDNILNTNDMVFLARPVTTLVGINSTYSLNWIVSGSEESGYKIYSEGLLISSGEWNSGEEIIFNVSKLFSNTGIYEITIIVSNKYGDSIEDTVVINVVTSFGVNTEPTPSINIILAFFVIISISGVYNKKTNRRTQL